MRGSSLPVRPRLGFGLSLALVAVVLAGGGCQLVLRQYAIDDCRERGGQAVVPPWYASDPADVRCVVGP